MARPAPKTRSRRDQLADDDVLFEAVKIVLLALDGRTSQDSDSMLEGGCRKEAVGIEGGLADTQKGRLSCSLATTLGSHFSVALGEDPAVHQFTWQELGIARGGYHHPVQHLADDYLEMLIVDVHPLRAVDLLNL